MIMRGNKNKYAHNFEFHTSIFNQACRVTTHNFDDKLKISDSVDFEQPKLWFKNYSNKNHHIFRTSRTSAFIYHPWIPLKLILTLRLITILALCWIFSSPDPNLTSRVLLEATIIKKHWNFLSGSTTRRSSPSWLLGCSLALGRSGPPSVERSCQ